MNRVRKFWRLPWADQWLLVQCFLWVLVVRASLSLFTFEQVRVFLRRFQPTYPDSLILADEARIQRVVQGVSVASKVLLPKSPCLTQALVAQTLLARQRYPTALRIGVIRPKPNSLKAHAWLEKDGQIIIGQIDQMDTFIPLS